MIVMRAVALLKREGSRFSIGDRQHHADDIQTKPPEEVTMP
jgi:hypothetical protein